MIHKWLLTRAELVFKIKIRKLKLFVKFRIFNKFFKNAKQYCKSASKKHVCYLHKTINCQTLSRAAIFQSDAFTARVDYFYRRSFETKAK